MSDPQNPQFHTPTEILAFTAKHYAAHPATKGVRTYSNANYQVLGLALEWLNRKRLSTLIDE